MAAYDQLFKDLLRTFFPDFLTLFLPSVAQGVDLIAPIDFLNTEVFTDLPAGLLRRADLVARIIGGGEQPEIVLVHTETQAKPDPTLPERLWAYNAMLRLRENHPVISVALLPFADEGTEAVRKVMYSETLFGEEYARLTYWQIALKGVAAEPYVEAGPALGVGLAALMTPVKDDRLALKKAVLRRLRALSAEDQLDQARLRLLVNLVETVLTLRKKERRREGEEGPAMDMEIVDEIELTWAEELLAEGREQGRTQGSVEGRVEGRAEGRREDIALILNLRFGSAPVEVIRRLESADATTLDRLFEAALRVGTLDEFSAVLTRS